jgi:hypothetical protein
MHTLGDAACGSFWVGLPEVVVSRLDTTIKIWMRVATVSTISKS